MQIFLHIGNLTQWLMMTFKYVASISSLTILLFLDGYINTFVRHQLQVYNVDASVVAILSPLLLV